LPGLQEVKQALRNILIVSTGFLWPLHGERERSLYQLVRGLHAAGVQTTLIGMHSPRRPVSLRSLPAPMPEWADYRLVEVDTRVGTGDLLAGFVFSEDTVHIRRFHSRRFEDELDLLLEKESFEVVQLESVWLLHYVPVIRKRLPKAVIALRPHRIEWEFWEQRANLERRPVREYFCRENAFRIRGKEEFAIAAGAYDVCVPMSGRDEGKLKEMGLKKPSFVLPVGAEAAPPGGEAVFPSIYLRGPFGPVPVQRGAEWFLREVWPQVHRAHPKVRCTLVGEHLPPAFRAFGRGEVAVSSDEEEAEAVIGQAAILAAPVLGGGPLRYALAEGMIRGKAVVATPQAAEGIGLKHGDQALIASDAGAFASHLHALIEHRSLADTLGAHAEAFARSRLENGALVRKLAAFYDQQIAAKNK
jgi:hypothetical protein